VSSELHSLLTTWCTTAILLVAGMHSLSLPLQLQQAFAAQIVVFNFFFTGSTVLFLSQLQGAPPLGKDF
jgi:hypothetical protein